ncbi:MAG: HAMP domain-containing histidine kinase [Candidatus Eremiobacteraeota bacterium]|nr:HAMP domain-containing histidine kinase [Candidatus Eremiobacteraeota bacterium]
MSDAFAPFARRLTRSYVILALALIVLVVAATSVLAFLLDVGTLNEAIAGDAHRLTQRALAYQRAHQPLRAYAPIIVGEIGGPRVGVHVYDDDHQLLARSERGRAGPPGRFTAAVAMLSGVRPAVVDVPGGTIVVVPDLEGFARLLARYLAFVLPIGALAVIVAWIVGRAISRRAIAPLHDVARALRRIAAGELPEPLNAGESSIRELTAAYNALAHRLAAATLERERNELQMRQFVADAGHELRTPLTIVMGYLEILQQGIVGEAAVGDVYETMLAQSRRMRASIEKLILLARLERPQPPQTEAVDAGALTQRVAEALRPLAGDRIGLTIPPSSCIVAADEGELYEALRNVVENAIRYAPESPISIDVSCENSLVTIVVSDRGPGMEPRDLENAFDRFYRGGTRSGEGSGLGLAIAKRAVERIGGTIELKSRRGLGTQVTIALPRARET